MIDLNDVQSNFSDDIDAVNGWCDEVYEKNFAPHFGESRELFNRLKSKSHPITDEELSWILIDLPLNLFDISEVLNRFKVSQEVVKMHTKQRESEVLHNSSAKTAALRQDEASLSVLEEKLLITAYSSVMTRVESEISFCRELIMGAKKIWDSRRKSEETNPVSPPSESPSLPDYQVGQYIKGSE